MTIYKVPIERRSKPCRFRNLTDLEIRIICNGCGVKGGWFKPPDYRFKASCDQHDFNWWLGGNKQDLKRSDRAFLKAMLHDAKYTRCGTLRPWWRRCWYKGAAYRYYWAVIARQSDVGVTLFGKGGFNFHAPENQDQQWSRLERYMDANGAEPDEALWNKEDWE